MREDPGTGARRTGPGGHGGATALHTLHRLAAWMEGKEEVHVRAPGTDITLNVAGRTSAEVATTSAVLVTKADAA